MRHETIATHGCVKGPAVSEAFGRHFESGYEIGDDPDEASHGDADGHDYPRLIITSTPFLFGLLTSHDNRKAACNTRLSKAYLMMQLVTTTSLVSFRPTWCSHAWVCGMVCSVCCLSGPGFLTPIVRATQCRCHTRTHLHTRTSIPSRFGGHRLLGSDPGS